MSTQQSCIVVKLTSPLPALVFFSQVQGRHGYEASDTISTFKVVHYFSVTHKYMYICRIEMLCLWSASPASMEILILSYQTNKIYYLRRLILCPCPGHDCSWCHSNWTWLVLPCWKHRQYVSNQVRRRSPTLQPHPVAWLHEYHLMYWPFHCFPHTAAATIPSPQSATLQPWMSMPTGTTHTLWCMNHTHTSLMYLRILVCLISD